MVNAIMPYRNQSVGRRSAELARTEGDAEEITIRSRTRLQLGVTLVAAGGRRRGRGQCCDAVWWSSFSVFRVSRVRAGRARRNQRHDLDPEKAVLPGVTITAVNGTGLERRRVGREGGSSCRPCSRHLHDQGRAAGLSADDPDRGGAERRAGADAQPDAADRGRGRERDGHRRSRRSSRSTSSRIGTNITSSEIDGLPSANRSQFSLMQTIPGLVPVLQVGSFEGGQFSANGQATTNNLFLVDGQNDNDSRRGGSQGTQARVSLDSMAEYQVQTHQYGAEYRRLDRRRRQQRDQERHQQIQRPRLRVLPGQQAAGDRLLPEAGGRGESRTPAATSSAAASAARSSGTSCSTSPTTKARAPRKRRT